LPDDCTEIAGRLPYVPQTREPSDERLGECEIRSVRFKAVSQQHTIGKSKKAGTWANDRLEGRREGRARTSFGASSLSVFSLLMATTSQPQP
jgi:hypothetical protein